MDRPGSESEYVSVADTTRESFHKHPWSIGGGGAAELKELLDKAAAGHLESLATAIGRTTHTGTDEAYFAPIRTWSRLGIPTPNQAPLVEGDTIRDWSLAPETKTILPYDTLLEPIPDRPDDPVIRHLWTYKQFLVRRREPGGTHAEIGLTWYEWSRFQRERFLDPAWNRLRLRSHAQPLRPRPRRQSVQAERAGDQAAAGGDRGRPPRPARAAEQLGGVFLDEADLLLQRRGRNKRGHKGGEMGTVRRA